MDLRTRVFCHEQGVSAQADRDGRDPEATHVVAVDGERVIGTCRLLYRGRAARLGRLAVEPNRRRQGVGRAILREAERLARADGADRISLHAQSHAKSLYARDGYAERGAPFAEEGIEHVTMEKVLA
jgi:predicted GNAT family N-acyltransferase